MFVLSAFGLDVWSDAKIEASPTEDATRSHLTRRLSDFLEGERALQLRIKQDPSEHRAEECGSPSYSLGFDAWESGPGRFVPPRHWHGASTAAQIEGVLMNFICRIGPSGHADMWVRVNHVGADGVPIQEMLSRLEAAWGVEHIVYPTPLEFAAHARPRPSPGRTDLGMLQAFIDFTPLLSWRKIENARLPEPMTFSAAVLWRLAQHPRLEGRYMGTTVEVAATAGLDRAVGVVVVRPADYFGQRNGLARYVRDFNRRVERTRRRASASCKTLDAAALVPPQMAEALLRHGLDQGTTAFGSLGLTVLKDAKVFCTPIGDTGHSDGFIAVGSVALPTNGGRQVGCVTVKGPWAKLDVYADILAELSR